MCVYSIAAFFVITALFVKHPIRDARSLRKKRLGLNEKVFKLYRFFIMTDQKDDQGNLPTYQI